MNSSYMGDPASLSPVFLSARASWTRSQDPDCTFCRILGGQYSPGNRAQGTEDCLPAYPGLSVAKIWTGCTCEWVIGEGLGLTLRSGTPCVPGRGKLKDAEGKLYKHNSRVQTHCEAGQLGARSRSAMKGRNLFWGSTIQKWILALIT